MAVTRRIGVGDVVSITVVVAAPCLVSDRRIGSRAPGNITQSARLANCQKAIPVPRSQWITRLEDACSADSPPARQIAYRTSSAIQAFQLVVETEGETVWHIKNRGPVVLLRIEPRRIGICQTIILGTRSSIRDVHKPARKMSPEVEDQRVVVTVAVVVGIADCTEAGIEPRRVGNTCRRTRVHLVDQVTGKSINVDSVRDIADGITVAHDIVGVGPAITDAGCKIVPNLPLQGCRPDVRFRRL